MILFTVIEDISKGIFQKLRLNLSFGYIYLKQHKQFISELWEAVNFFQKNN